MRKAPLITLDELKKHVDPLINAPKFSDIVYKDLYKIQFDFENVIFDGDICGYKILSNNLPVMVGYAGGDWEFPVAFILYWDGKKLRAYIPENGNVYNKKEKKAWDYEDAETLDYDWEKIEECIIKRIQII